MCFKIIRAAPLTLFLAFVCLSIVYGQFMNGVSSYFKTPNGNIICDEHEVSSCVNASVGELGKWYFYKDRIIGTSDSGYFILNESNIRDSVYTTHSETEWLTQLERQNLKPVLWTKWYTMDDGSWGESEQSEFGKHWTFYSLSCVTLLIGFLMYRSTESYNKKIFVYGFCLLAGFRVWLFLSV
ncbi:hypothetical protein IC229_19765 [Spirosoma sp. BT702]|uniref:Uncharacterized protein n=1 Tax=Spirosoma profusum TaxID=2771354 RepID=A0A926XY21_9BACT|nr:hypothetical protein [Spirosoma profusum]MBD2702894.1 hypothetical protein [Spirosoma profusum]